MTYADIRRMLDAIGAERSEWAGLPMLVSGQQLIVEERYPYKQLCEPPPGPVEEAEIVNSWYSERLQASISIVREKDGRLWAGKSGRSVCAKELNTVFCSVAWKFDAEVKAVEKLASLVAGHKLQSYIMAGCFVETSKRSGITYMFRRLRPTVAIRNERILAALCRHSIGYYAGTWAGVMVPTDEVVAALLLMRGDEPGFWRDSNQHHPSDPGAGL